MYAFGDIFDNMKNHIQYAVQETRTIHISEVESGLACNCHCAACGSKLVAKKGDVVIHHFAHYNQEDCKYGFETALHLGVKRILEKEMRFRFPKVVGETLFGNSVQIYPSMLLPIIKLCIEQPVEQIIPDIILQTGNSICLIEVYVTHKVDLKKLEIIKRKNIATLEIDFSNVDREIDDNVIRDALINCTVNKKWLHNPKAATWEEQSAIKTKREIKMGMIDSFKITRTEYHFDGIFGCPLLPLHRKRWSTSAHESCFSCKHFISNYGNQIFCNARYDLWKKTHYLELRTKGEKAIIDYPNTQAYLDSLGICPRCGYLLIPRKGKFGPFIACKGFPTCTFSQNIDPETGEITRS